MDNNTQLDMDTVITRNDTKFLANKIGDEMVMMNLESGDFVSMNNVGAEIWSLTDKAITFRDLIVKLMMIYEISEEQCIKETNLFLTQAATETMFTMQNAAMD